MGPKPQYFLLAPIADDQGSGRRYRGLDRLTLAQTLPPTGPAQDLFVRAVLAMDGGEWVDGFASVKTATAYQQRFADMGFRSECISAWCCKAKDDARGAMGEAGFLGFDISNTGRESILNDALVAGKATIVGEHPVGRDLWSLCRRFAEVILNRHGLFDAFSDAELYLRVAHQAQRIDGDERYYSDQRVVAIGLVGP